MKNSYWKNEKTVVDPETALYGHDKSPMQKALLTQQMFKDLDIDFLGNDEWAGDSPDLNTTENLEPSRWMTSMIVCERLEHVTSIPMTT